MRLVGPRNAEDRHCGSPCGSGPAVAAATATGAPTTGAAADEPASPPSRTTRGPARCGALPLPGGRRVAAVALALLQAVVAKGVAAPPVARRIHRAVVLRPLLRPASCRSPGAA